MRRKFKFIVWLQFTLLLWVGFLLLAEQKPEPEALLPSPRQLWERLRTTLPALSYSIVKDEIVQSDTDPGKNLRRVEVRFISQVIDGAKMGHTGIIFMPPDAQENKNSDRKGKVVVATHNFEDDMITPNYAEPTAARTGYPTMSLLLPGDYNREDGEMKWLRLFRQRARDTQDPIHHDLFRSAVPYIQALDIFSDLLKEKEIRAVIGAHSKRAYYAYTAAAIDPERIAGVVYMGCERLFSNDEMFPDPSEVAWFSDDQAYPPSLIPFHAQRYVQSPGLYLGATNEGGYAMFNINRIQERLEQKWTIEYIPNYRHESRSEKQFMDWQMWVSHIFEGRPITEIHDFSFKEDTEGTFFRARIDTKNKIIQVKAWYVYCEDDPYWRNLMWFPVIMKPKQGNLYEGYVSGELPDAWLVEVKDIARGFSGYVSSPPQDITHKPAKVRGPGFARKRQPKQK